MRLHLHCKTDDSGGRMTDNCSANSAQKELGSVEKKGQFAKRMTQCHGHSAVICSQSI